MSDWDRSHGVYRDVLGAENVALGPGRAAYAFGDHGWTSTGGHRCRDPVAREPVRPRNSDLCFVWTGTAEDAFEHLRAHRVDVGTGPVERPGGPGAGRSVCFRDPTPSGSS